MVTTDRLFGISASLAVKAPCKAVAVSNITLSGEQTVNGVAVVAGNRVLVTAQTDAVDNGIYVVSASAWQRAADFDGNRDVGQGTLVIVNRSDGGDYFYQVETADPIVIGTSEIEFTLSPKVTHDVSDAEVTAGVTPINLEHEIGNVLRYGTNTTPGTTDMTSAFQAAASVIETQGGGVFRVPSGHYRIIDEIDFGTTSNVTIEIDAGAIIDCSSVAASETDAIFLIGSVTEGQTTTLTAAVDRGDTSIEVDDSTGFAAGDFCALVSNDEYWDGDPGSSGFSRKTKGELVFIRSVDDANTITLETAADESYSITGLTVSLIKLPKTENVKIRCDGVFIGDGGGTDHTASNPTGMRAFKMRCVVGAKVSGGTFKNFPRAAGEFQLCSGVRVHDNTLIGRKLDDPTNLPNISVWFAGMFFLGCDGVTFSNNTGMFLRRHYDPDSFNALSTGMVIGRSHVVEGNTAIACLEPFGGHAVRDVTYSNNKSRSCVRGAAFRGRDVTMTNNRIGFITGDAMISIGGSTNMGYSTTESPNVGHVTLKGNTGSASARGIQISGDVESLNSDGNTIVVGHAAGSEVGIGYMIRSVRAKNINIGPNDVIDLTDRVDNAIGVLQVNNSGACLIAKDFKIQAKIINPYIGVSLSGSGDSNNEATNIQVDVRVVDAEHALVALTNSGIGTDSDGFWGRDVAVKVSYGGTTEPTNLLKMPADANKVRFRRRPSFECDKTKRFIGYGDASDLAAGETVSDGDYMYDPATYTETYFTSDGTIGDDGGVTITINSGQTAGTITAQGALLAKGQYVRIAGAGAASGNLDTRVASKSESSVTFEDAAGTSVVSAALSFLNPSTDTLAPS